jgi:protein SCO1/2
MKRLIDRLYRDALCYRILLATIVFFLSGIGYIECQNEIEIAPTPLGGDFTLQSKSGKYSLNQSNGKVVLIYFGFTSCPVVCPTTLSNIAQAFKALNSDELKQVQALFISIDPERDTLDKLQKYSSYFHSQILTLTGSIKDLKNATSLYGASFRKVKVPSGMEYTMDHTTSVFIVDQKGKWVDTISHGATSAEFKKAIHKVLGDKN